MGKVDPIFSRGVTHLDIVSCLNGKDKPIKWLYICPKTYPPPQSSFDKNANETISWIHLKRDIEKTANEH